VPKKNIEDSRDWEAITDFGTREEADAALRTWTEAHGEVAEDDLRMDIGRGLSGKTVFRFQRRRSTPTDIERP
jgi:hypothetical protein